MHPCIKQGDFGDITDRKALRERLQCKSFDWYMHNVWPAGFNPKTALKRGQVQYMYRLAHAA